MSTIMNHFNIDNIAKGTVKILVVRVVVFFCKLEQMCISNIIFNIGGDY